ncbi:MAG: glucose 1-dehydrogenase [Rhizobiaceae bacterium]
MTQEQQSSPVVVISGGSRGLGLSVVNKFLAQGCRVATFSRSKTAEVEALEDKLGAGSTGQFMWQQVDGASEQDVREAVKTITRNWGRIDTLVNNAGTGHDGLLALQRMQDVDQLLDINLRSAILLTQLCSKSMIRNKSGSIVNISSVNSVRGHSGVAVYSATKAALDGLTRSLARELGPMNIRVNSVAPGYFESAMVGELSEAAKKRIQRRTPLGRLADPDEITEAVYFLASQQGSFITGQTLVVDGGLTC